MSDHTSSSQEQHSNEEESTIFRSIPLGSASAMQPLAPLQPLGLRPLSAGKPSLQLPGKLMVAPLTTPVAPKKPSLNWKLDASAVPSVPDYPLERTHLVCPASLPLDQITERICRVLEAHSLDCAFHDDDSSTDSTQDEEILPARLDCSSDSDLKFVVQLWRREDDCYVVEMQRRRGSSLEFSAIRKPLFQTLQTGTLAPKKKPFAPPAFSPNKKFRVLPPARTPAALSA